MVGKITPDHMASASIVPSILGVNPYQTQNDVLRSCINASHGMNRKPLADPRRADFGNAIEPFLAKMACDAVGGHSLKTEFPDPYFHEELELAASLDATCVAIGRIQHAPEKGIYVMTGEGYIDIEGTGIIECKNTAAAATDEPAAYRGPWQLQAQMMCAKLNWGIVVTLYQGWDLRFYIYRAEPSMQTLIKNRITDFALRIKSEEFYPPTNSGDVNCIFPEALPGEPAPLAELSVDLDGVVEDIQAARRVIKSTEEKIDQLQMVLKGALGNHEQGVTKNYHLTWKMREATPERLVTYKAKDRERAGTVTFKKLKQEVVNG
jgi:predicted phage-related endonuclease